MSPQLNLDGIKAVIFDLDGTLYDRKGLPRRLIAHSLHRLSLLGNERKVRGELAGQWFGEEQAYYDRLFTLVAQRSHTSPSRVRRWYNDEYMPLMQRMLERHYHIEPWVQGLMADLRRQGLRTAVYSDYGCLPQRLQALRFSSQWVDVLADAPALGGAKPCAEAGLRLCEMLQAAPRDILLVGDRDDTDGETARRCGMRFHLIEGLS